MGQRPGLPLKNWNKNLSSLKEPWKDKYCTSQSETKSEIRSRTQVKDILEKIKESKWRWTGHVAGMQDNRWTKRVTEWQPRSGRRIRGRQKRRWRDVIIIVPGLHPEQRSSRPQKMAAT